MVTWRDSHWCTVIKQREKSHERADGQKGRHSNFFIKKKCYATDADFCVSTAFIFFWQILLVGNKRVTGRERELERVRYADRRERERGAIISIKCLGNVWDGMSWQEQNNKEKWRIHRAMLPYLKRKK